MQSEKEHFVYIYRDKSGNPVYFGQGKHATRPTSHTGKLGSHNKSFDAWLKSQAGQHKVEVIGPLGNKVMADAIETALISACLPAQALKKSFFNVHKGNGDYRFRPYGVPDSYAARTTRTLNLSELDAIRRRVKGTLMFVRINQKDFDDGPGRKGYDLTSPPTDGEIRARIEAWWQVAAKTAAWAENPATSPALLLGVTGLPGAQTIIASARIHRRQWRTAERGPNGLLKIPLMPGNLDAERLRGRSIDASVDLRFNAFRAAQFRILGPQGFEHAQLADKGTAKRAR